MFNRNLLRQLKNSVESGSGERAVLANIARGCSATTVIGAQEAVSHLLGYTLLFQSEKRIGIKIEFILYKRGALSEQEEKRKGESYILPYFDAYQNVAIPLRN